MACYKNTIFYRYLIFISKIKFSELNLRTFKNKTQATLPWDQEKRIINIPKSINKSHSIF